MGYRGAIIPSDSYRLFVAQHMSLIENILALLRYRDLDNDLFFS